MYIQVADYICREILQGTWKPGMALPPLRELCIMLEINPHTAERAVKELVQKGILTDADPAEVKAGADVIARELLVEYFKEYSMPQMLEQMRLLNIKPAELISYLQNTTE